jgi:hypothetical protein
MVCFLSYLVFSLDMFGVRCSLSFFSSTCVAFTGRLSTTQKIRENFDSGLVTDDIGGS